MEWPPSTPIIEATRPDAVAGALEAYRAEHPEPRPTVADVADHVDHLRELAGVGHIGVGGDFDGTFAIADGLDDVGCYPNLFAELLSRGYSEDDVAKISRENILGVMRSAEATAQRLQAERGPSRAVLSG